MTLKHISKWTGAALLLVAATAGRAAKTGTPEWFAQWKTGIVCEDFPLYGEKGYIGCDGGIEKAMRAAAAQLPPLPNGVVITVQVEGNSPYAKDIADSSIMVMVVDETGVRPHSVGYAIPMHCTFTHEEECGRSAIYRGYLTWEMSNYVAEGMNEKR
jgi:hypothetical protein